jgi:hypothetical protein
MLPATHPAARMYVGCNRPSLHRTRRGSVALVRGLPAPYGYPVFPSHQAIPAVLCEHTLADRYQSQTARGVEPWASENAGRWAESGIP